MVRTLLHVQLYMCRRLRLGEKLVVNLGAGVLADRPAIVVELLVDRRDKETPVQRALLLGVLAGLRPFT